MRSAPTHPLVLAAATLLAAVGGTACGDVAQQHGPVVFAGAVNGVFHPGPPAACGTGPALVTGPYGGGVSHTADMTVSDDGTVKVSVPGVGDFTGTGASFRDAKGWDIDADVTSANGSRIHVQGELGC